VSQVGWAAVPAATREGVGDPAPATSAYRDQLRGYFSMHGAASHGSDQAFERFVEGQLTWDRAFAEALHGAAQRHPGALAVGIVGFGHLRDGHGVPHQLRALGAKRVKVWLPVPAETPCSELSAGIADAVFAVENARTTPPQRLGIVLDEGDAGPQVREVLSGSIAESAGVRQGDRVVAAAGDRVSSASDLIAAVRRQAPGTWLPLKIVRAGKEIDLVAKFPAQP
jgi:membrane-associated protease RseP (regulator of RpoE activity)